VTTPDTRGWTVPAPSCRKVISHERSHNIGEISYHRCQALKRTEGLALLDTGGWRTRDRRTRSHLRCQRRFDFWLRNGRGAESASMRAFAASLWRILYFWVCMALVCVPKPGGPFLLAAYKSNPLVTTSTQSFPYIRIAIHASSFLWLLEGTPCCSANTVCETLIVPESAVLQNKPTPGLANPAPSFTLISMTTHPSRCIQVSVKAQFLLVRYKIRICWVHVL